MRYTPKRSGRAADVICLVFFICAAVLGWANAVTDGYRAAFQIPSVIFLTAGIYTLVRYRLMGYNYVIKARNSDDGGMYAPTDIDFTVEKIQGKRVWTECRVSLGDIVEITKIPRSKRSLRLRKDVAPLMKNYPKTTKLYYYTVNLFPQSAYLMMIRDGAESAEDACIGIIFEPDETMVDQIKYLSNNKFD
jgi:hypothetical protein